MIDVVEVDIQRPIATVAALHADPTNTTRWMHDVERVEYLSGATGSAGSRYRLIPRKGSLIFEATVMAVDLPRELRLTLQGPGIFVAVKSSFTTLPTGGTRLRSEEVFSFKGVLHRLIGILAGPSIRRVHRAHLEAFRQFAEQA